MTVMPNTEREVKKGATVKLKSGGPVMTANLRTAAGWRCCWFSHGELREGTFSLEALEVVDAEDSGTHHGSHND